MLIPVILAGGHGTRLWPVSRATHPKPFIRLPDGQSLLQKTLIRAAELADQREVLTVTGQELYFKTREEYAALQDQLRLKHDLLLEPGARNTAPAVAMAALRLIETHGEEVMMLLLPADHFIEDIAAFKAAVVAATRLAEEGHHVALGASPSTAETAYGYIELGELLSEAVALNGSDPLAPLPACYRVKTFVEKPERELAEAYVRAKGFLWNTGILCVRAQDYLHALRKYADDVYAAVTECWQQTSKQSTPLVLDRASFEAIRETSIDHAVLERVGTLATVDCAFSWCDVGTWNAMSDLVPADVTGNRVEGSAVVLDSSNCFVHSKSRLTAMVGVDNLIVVDTPDALLVADRERAQDVRELVQRLKISGHEAYREHRTVFRPWGNYTTIEEGEHFKVKRIVVKPGAALSLQMHHHRSEHWVVVRGTARIVNGTEERLLRPNESTYIPAGERHRLSNPGVLELVLIEVQSGAYLGEDDIVRLEDQYGRA